MNTNYIKSHRILISSGEADLKKSSLRLKEESRIPGGFNPPLCRLSNRNLYHSGPGIQMAPSKDIHYCQPKDESLLYARKSFLSNEKIGGRSPPILTSEERFPVYHFVESNGGRCLPCIPDYPS